MRVLLTEAMQEKKISFRGLEKLTGISVEKTYIYSFKLGKEIEIKYE